MSQTKENVYIRFKQTTKYSFVLKMVIGEEDNCIVLISNRFWLLQDLQRIFGMFVFRTPLSLEKAYLAYESFKKDHPDFPRFYIDLCEEAKREYDAFLSDNKTKNPSDLH